MESSWRPPEWTSPYWAMPTVETPSRDRYESERQRGQKLALQAAYEAGASAIIPYVEAEVKAQMRRGRSEDNCWIWLGDGEDHLENLCCPVLIEADQLRELLEDKRRETAEQIMEFVKDWYSLSDDQFKIKYGQWPGLRLNVDLALPVWLASQGVEIPGERG